MIVRIRPSDFPLPSHVYEVQLELQSDFTATVCHRGEAHMMWLESIEACCPDRQATLARVLMGKHAFSEQKAIAASALLFNRLFSSIEESGTRVDPSN